MAKSAVQDDKEFLKHAKEQALDLVKLAFAEARQRGKAVTSEALPPLFPNGIDLIHVKFEVTGLNDLAKVAIDVEVAGPKPKTP